MSAPGQDQRQEPAENREARWQALLDAAVAQADPIQAAYRAQLAELTAEPESNERDAAMGQLWSAVQQELATLRREYVERANAIIQQLRRAEWEAAKQHPHAGLIGFIPPSPGSRPAFVILLDGDQARTKLHAAFTLHPPHAAIRSGYAPARPGDALSGRSTTDGGMPREVHVEGHGW